MSTSIGKEPPPTATPSVRGGRLLEWWRASGEAAVQEVDTTNATRLGALVALVVAALEVVFVILDHPTRLVGSAGWVLTGALVTATAIAGWSLYDRRTPLPVDHIFLLGVIGMIQVALVSVLTGTDPVRQLLMFWLALCVAISPPPRAGLALVLAYIAGALPLLAIHIDSRLGTQLLADYLFWAVLAVLVHLLLAGVRKQRRSFASERYALGELARRDELTGLGNRRALQEALEELHSAVQSDGGPGGTLAIFDIESFKQINDIEGLGAGDRCLRTVGQSLLESVASPGAAFRWGGDEFVVMLPGLDLATARTEVERLRGRLADCCLGADGRPLRTRWGLGHLNQGVRLEDALAAADLELLEQKGMGHPAPNDPRLRDGPRRYAGTGG